MRTSGWMLLAGLSLAGCQTGGSNAVDLNTLIVGKTVQLQDSRLTYSASGQYTYTSASTTSRGTYTIDGDRVCVNFAGGQRRCDRYVDSGGTYYLVNSQGTRFRVLGIT